MECFVAGGDDGALPEVLPRGFPIDTTKGGIVIPLLDGLPDFVKDTHPLPLVKTCVRFGGGSAGKRL
jgi:hypothetical protein